jgi:septal ring-binding cell division protein DamX
MEEERNRGKEYYQVNLDMGRLFWIAFLIGIVLISVFVFGFVIGGDRTTSENRLDALKRGGSELFTREKVTREKLTREQARDELKILDLFDNELEAETRYIDVESLEEAVKETESIAKSPVQEPLFVPPAEEIVFDESPVLRESTPPAVENKTETSSYRPVGDYFIQVGSFSREANAREFAQKLEKNLYKVNVVEADVGGKTYYRVHVGPFEQQSVAINTMTSMKRIFKLKDPFVLKMRS